MVLIIPTQEEERPVHGLDKMAIQATKKARKILAPTMNKNDPKLSDPTMVMVNFSLDNHGKTMDPVDEDEA